MRSTVLGLKHIIYGRGNQIKFAKSYNINWRDVQTKNVVNNVDMSCLRAPWQNGPYKT